MAIYQNFAQVYDRFMADVPYDEWVAFVERLFVRLGKKPLLVLELACGTGNITTRLAKKGYNMIGLDSSAEMLSAAKNKDNDKDNGILYTLQDMRGFELYGTVDCALCLCDGINYVTGKNELLKVFRSVKNYLNPGGLFIFDVNTEHKYEHTLAANTFTQTEKGAAYIWENFYDKKRRLNEYVVTFFVEDVDGLYKRFEERHLQRAYSDEEIRKAAKKARLNVMGAFDMDKLSLKPPRKKAERVVYILEG